MLRRPSGELNGVFVALVAAVVGIAVGSIAPWVMVTGLINVSRGGLDAGDGWITLGAAATCAPLLWMQARRDGVGRLMAIAILAVIATAVAVTDLADIKGTVDDTDVKLAAVDAGWGLYFVAASGGLAVVLVIGLALDAAQERVRRRRELRRRQENERVSAELVLLASVLAEGEADPPG
jgi:hypothetical protein